MGISEFMGMNATTALPMPERFWSKTRKNNECIEWIACLNTTGYGSFWHKGRWATASRVAYEITHGEIPFGLCVLHKCDNRKCVNPDHLYIGTKKQNMQDRIERKPDSYMKGQTNGRAKLIDSQVLEIRNSSLGNKNLAKQFNVSEGTIESIKSRRTWKHI